MIANEPPRLLPDGNDSGTAKVYSYQFKDMVVDFLLWSPLTDTIKERLDFDAPKDDPNRMGEFPYERAKLNNQLKLDLLNDCLADVAIYLGPNGEPIRRAMRQTLCNTLGGQYVEVDSPKDWCDLSSGPNGQVVFVTESLGSKLLFDALRDLLDEKYKKWEEAESDDQKERTKKELRTVVEAVRTTHFMISNQIPILDLGGDLWFHKIPDIFSEKDIHGDGKDSQSLVVSFTDPNDLLSYRLLPTHMRHSDEFVTNRLVNVLVSNANTYFDIFEHPLYAHSGYELNPYIVGLIVRGFAKGGPLPRVFVSADPNNGAYRVE